MPCIDLTAEALGPTGIWYRGPGTTVYVARYAYPPWFDPAAFRDAFQLDTGRLPLAEVLYSVRATVDSDSVDVAQEYVDHEGIYRIELLRRIRDIVSTKVAQHVGFYVLDDPPHARHTFQRRGLATGHLRKVLPLYDNIGVTMIQLAAARDGRTVWPKFGFQIDDAERAEFENMLIALEVANTGRRPARTSLPVTGPDILSYSPGGYPLGIRALEGRDSWLMRLDLTESAQRRILEARCRA